MILKRKFNIKTIGKKYFFIGIYFGLMYLLLLNLFELYQREAFRIVTFSTDRDLYQLSEIQYTWIDIIISLINASCAFGITLIAWVLGTKSNNDTRKFKFQRITIITWIVFIIGITLSVSYRMISLGSFFSATMFVHTILLEFIDIRVFLIAPIAIYFMLWHKIQTKFFANRYLWICFFIVFGIGIFFGKFHPLDRTILSDRYNNIFQSEHDFINRKIEKLENFDFNKSKELTKQLKTKQSEQVYNLLKQSKIKFSTQKYISIDTLILQQILIHNFNAEYFYCNSRFDNCWLYAEPKDILRLINENYNNDKILRALFEILKEQLDYLNSYDCEYDFESTDYSSYDYRKHRMAEWTFKYKCQQIPYELREVWKELNFNEEYFKYKEYLPNPNKTIEKLETKYNWH